MTIELDRIALEDVGANPERLARAIHDQLGKMAGPVPCTTLPALWKLWKSEPSPSRALKPR